MERKFSMKSITWMSEIPCRVSNIAQGSGDTTQMTGSNRWNPNDAVYRCVEGNTEGKIRDSREGAILFPRNDLGCENLRWSRQLVHNTPALIIVYASRFLHFRFRGWRRLFLRFIPTEQTSLLGLGGSTEFLGQPERRSSSASLRDQRKVELRIHTTRSIRQDDQIRSEKCR